MRQLIYKIVQQKMIMATASILWLLVITTISLVPYQPGDILPETDTAFRWDYLEHFIGFFLLGILTSLWRSDKNFSVALPEIILIIAAGLGLSFTLEYCQIFIPGRTFNMIDLAFNMAGLVAGVLAGYFLILQILLRKSVPPE